MRFVVDNELRCSDLLPTATDSMGNFVNYIEVGMDLDASSPTEEPRRRHEGVHQGEEWLQQQSQQKQEYEQQTLSGSQQYSAQDPLKAPVEADCEMILNDDDDALSGGGYERFHEELPLDPVYKFSSVIPAVFTDPEVMEQFVASDFVTPPQLPPHLESVILNSNSNEKDNNSVLPIPNHVVLNHLATTSIKHNVLAVASISRYSRKYVTQILYAPL